MYDIFTVMLIMFTTFNTFVGFVEQLKNKLKCQTITADFHYILSASQQWFVTCLLEFKSRMI